MTTLVTTTLLDQTGNINMTGANITLGPAANIHISGGSKNQTLISDGANNLSWVDVDIINPFMLMGA